ncbi:MAG: hypothetical protein KFB93_02860 [Simkaniaceae bacterium]|nr:MAG: hypothetical protein KFB93_02860 [Simkaniaceae bacterium]
MKISLRILFLITFLSFAPAWGAFDEPVGFYIESGGQNPTDQDLQTLISSINVEDYNENQVFLIYKPVYLTPCELLERIEIPALSPSERTAFENARSYDSGILIFQGPKHIMHSLKKALCLKDSLSIADLTSSRAHKLVAPPLCYWMYHLNNDDNPECILTFAKQNIDKFPIDDQEKQPVKNYLEAAKILNQNAILFIIACNESAKSALYLVLSRSNQYCHLTGGLSYEE